MRVISPVDFSDVSIEDSFWLPRLKAHKQVTIPVCIDQIENQTGRMKNFENAAKGEGKHSGIYFDDSDVYKALEGMAYSLQTNPDPELEAKCDEWIAKFAAAQQEDGYLFTYYTLTGLDERWTNMYRHEMYCAGHLAEAAVAYYRATGKRTLLDVALKMADHMMSIFGPGKRHWVPGHQEIELALVKLYDVTGERKYLDFADWLLQERGHGHFLPKSRSLEYMQDDKPVKEQDNIAGHAVRAMYLYCGMADVAAIKHDAGYMDALHRLWEDVVERNMYITGGIGSSKSNEGFTKDYDLPNLEAYCETCASVGMVLWNWRMNQMTGDARYADIMERSLYNGVLAGVSLSGDRFFYVNPLESLGDHHRQAWYGCACCPSQICRFLPSIGNYIYGIGEDALYVNLFIGNRMEKDKIAVNMQTRYPWDGNVVITIEKTLRKDLRIRVPEWCENYSFLLDGEEVKVVIVDGYAQIGRNLKAGTVVEARFEMKPVLCKSDPRVLQNAGLSAVQRGPIVYCAEEVDNPGIAEVSFGENAVLEEVCGNQNFPDFVMVNADTDSGLIHLIPYFAWDNREAGRMKVWM